ncbi:MAG: class F sortase [bacterium]|nr:class F sortase [bacterium]
MNSITKNTLFFSFVLTLCSLYIASHYIHILAVKNVESAIVVATTTATQTQKKIIPNKTTYEKKSDQLRPVSISIPTARVDADVINVGVTKTNNLDVPPNFHQTGWYKFGTLPGNIGNAVIDGHVDNGGSIDGVFKHLKDVKSGDVITITLSDKTIVRYAVTKFDVVKTTEFPGVSVFTGTDKAVLKIITCHGKFVKSMDTYDQRLIVTAELL